MEITQEIVELVELIVPFMDMNGLPPDWGIALGAGESDLNPRNERHAPAGFVNGQPTLPEDSYGIYQIRIQSHPHPDGGAHWLGLQGTMNAMNEMRDRWVGAFNGLPQDWRMEDYPVQHLGPWDIWREWHLEGFAGWWSAGQGAVLSTEEQRRTALGIGRTLYNLHLKGWAGTPFAVPTKPVQPPPASPDEVYRSSAAQVLRVASRLTVGDVAGPQGWDELERAITVARGRVNVVRQPGKVG